MTTIHRVHNFSAGPAVMPLTVLEEIQRDLIALPGVGMSVLEISHRSKTFEDILAAAEADIRALAGIPANYKVLFLQGGASLQFSMVPMNLLGPGQTADYIDSGSWADKAIKEAKKVGTVNVAATTKGENYSRVPDQSELKLTPGAAYVHMTSNNTIEGTECKTLPNVGDVPLVSDTSSDMFSRPIDVGRHALIYSGAQKNMGPAGVVVVIIRDDLVQRSAAKKATLADDAQLRGACRELVALQHAAGVFGLRARVGDEVAAATRWIEGGCRGQRAQGGEALCRNRSDRLLSRHGAQEQPLADERDVPAGDRRSREAVHQGVDGGGARRFEGASRGRRHARIDLQRVSRGRRQRAGRIHARIRNQTRLGN